MPAQEHPSQSCHLRGVAVFPITAKCTCSSHGISWSKLPAFMEPLENPHLRQTRGFALPKSGHVSVRLIQHLLGQPCSASHQLLLLKAAWPNHAPQEQRESSPCSRGAPECCGKELFKLPQANLGDPVSQPGRRGFFLH